tara:strand:- start:693 stop:2945 length:2253 start_codon:yes stop_codon:yes gene_type:complete
MPAVGDDFGGFEAHSESQDFDWGFDDVNFDPSPPPGTNPGGAGESESGLGSLLPSTPAEWAGLLLTPLTLGQSYPMAKAISYPLSVYNLANRAGAFDRKDDTNTRGAPPNTMLAQAQPAINQKKGQSLNRRDSGDNPPPPSWDGGEPEYVPQIASVPGEIPSEVVEQVATVPSYESYFMGYDPDYDPYQAGFGAQPGLFGRREVVAESGGDVMNLRNQANQLASQGRGGDTMLMHMRPDEVAGLASLGGVTRNPTTGLPEGFLLPALGAALPGLMGWGAASIPMGALYSGLGAAGGQALQSKMLGEDDPLKKGLVAGLTAGIGSAALGGFGKAFGGGKLTEGAAAELGRAVGEGPTNPMEKMFGEGAGSMASNVGPKIQGWGDATRYAMAENAALTGGMLGGVGGMVSDAATMPGYGGPMPGEGTSGKSFRDPQAATPKTPRERTGLAQSGDLTSYGFRPEGLFFGEGVYAQSGGLPQAQALSRRPAWNPFRGHGQGVQGSVQEASGNLGEANQALQAATDQVNRAMGTLNPNQPMQQSTIGGKGGRRLQQIASPFGGQQAAQDRIYQQFRDEQQRSDMSRLGQQASLYKQEGGIAGLPEGGGDEVALQVTQDAVDAVRGEHPEPKIAIETFVSYFGPEAFDSLRRLVIQEESIRTMGKADGLVNGDDGGRDDIQRGTIDGDQELNISGGEYIFSADDVSLMGDGNTDAGARRLDQARANLRQKARGTTERPAYMGEGAAEEIFEEAMTG